MISDTDWNIMMTKLKALEDAVNSLSKQIELLSNEKNDCKPNTDYALKQGNLTDAGVEQVWSERITVCIDPEE